MCFRARLQTKIGRHPITCIIGQAFRWSMIFLAVVAVVAVGAWLVLRDPGTVEVIPEGDTVLPKAQDRDVTVPKVAFRDVTKEAGIDFLHENGAVGDKYLPESMGPGCAVFDYDGDGDQDILLTNGRKWDAGTSGGPTMKLYRNDGGMKFADVTAEVGLDVSLYGMGVAIADYDCDGRRDIFVTTIYENHLYRNTEKGFVDVSTEAGVAGTSDAWSTSAAFFDGDGDGDLDLYVCNYVRWSQSIDRKLDYRLTGVGRAYGPPANYGGTFSYLFRNDGKGHFEDVSEAAGMHVENPTTGKPVAKTLGVVPTDIDGDRDIDLVVANDTVTNFLFVNQGDGTFTEESIVAGIGFDRQGRATGAMGIDVAAYRDDGTRGIVIANFANEMSSLYVAQDRGGLFLDEAISEGVGAPSRKVLSFGVLFLDVDLDGRLDLLQANGHLENEISQVQASQSYEQPPQLFWNAGPDARRTFVEVEPAKTGELSQPVVGRGLNVADVDGDGDVDVLLTQSGRAPRLLRNDQAQGNHWLRLRVVGEGCARDAYNARVEVRVGGKTLHREVRPTRSYLTQVETVLTFGLGAHAEVEQVSVQWPDGEMKEYGALEVDRVHVLER